jgi:hypothetical protein
MQALQYVEGPGDAIGEIMHGNTKHSNVFFYQV